MTPAEQCPHAWGDFRCGLPEGHEGGHRLRWAADEDDE